MSSTPHFGDPQDDKELVGGVKRGDEAAFRKLIHLNQALVVAIVYKMISRPEDREDLCQDVFLKVYEKMHTFSFRSKLSTWIGSIAFNTCINFLQRRKTMLLEDLMESKGSEAEATVMMPHSVKDQGLTPGEKLENKERGVLLLKCMERLTVIQKAVLQLFHGNDLSLQEISEITDLPVSTVKSHLFRARKRLKEEFDSQ
jgi:RNA polymerase sigma-70 factor (ECF subfamily)